MGYTSTYLFVSIFANGKIACSPSPKIGVWGETDGKVIFSYDAEGPEELLFASPATKQDYLLLIADKDGDKRYRIISLSDFDKSISIQPRLTTTLIPEKGTYVFAEILHPEQMKEMTEEKRSLNSFDQFNAGRFWEHADYKSDVDLLTETYHINF